MIAEPVTEIDLQGYVDDVLPLARRSVVAAALSAEPVLAARVGAYVKDRERLRSALAAVTLQAVPPAWSQRITTATAVEHERRPLMHRRMAIAASIALVVGTGTATVLIRHNTNNILAEAQAGRADRLEVAETISIKPLQDSRPANDRLKLALGMPVKAPDLHRFGFTLTRLDLYARAAQLNYVDDNERILTIYVRPSDGHVRFDILHQHSTRICIWQDDVVGAVIMAPMAAGEMMRVASAAYADLNL